VSGVRECFRVLPECFPKHCAECFRFPSREALARTPLELTTGREALGTRLANLSDRVRELGNGCGLLTGTPASNPTATTSHLQTCGRSKPIASGGTAGVWRGARLVSPWSFPDRGWRHRETGVDDRQPKSSRFPIRLIRISP
jgi:hypothetical protein